MIAFLKRWLEKRRTRREEREVALIQARLDRHFADHVRLWKNMTADDIAAAREDHERHLLARAELLAREWYRDPVRMTDRDPGPDLSQPAFSLDDPKGKP